MALNGCGCVMTNNTPSKKSDFRLPFRAARPNGLKMKNSAAPAVKRKAEEGWGKKK